MEIMNQIRKPLEICELWLGLRLRFRRCRFGKIFLKRARALPFIKQEKKGYNLRGTKHLTWEQTRLKITKRT
jgi:hypothetical protein